MAHYNKPGIGEFNGDPYSWTGGFVYTSSRVNSFVIPNIFAGYNLHLPHAQGLELFAESRGLVRNHNQDLMDDRRYYTIGGKFTIQ